MPPMAPAYDRKRTSPVNQTDYKATAKLQGLGFAVVRVETMSPGSDAVVTWRNMPDASVIAAAEKSLDAVYSRFSHGT